MPRIMGADNDYALTLKRIQGTVLRLENYLTEEKKQSIYAAKECFGFTEKESLSSGLMNWYRLQSDQSKNYINSSRTGAFMNYLADLKGFDDEALVGDLAKIFTDLYIEDWTDTSPEIFARELQQTKEEIEGGGRRDAQIIGAYRFSITDETGHTLERSYDADAEDSTSYFLKNAIDSALDEFGESLETNQKVAVLIRTITDLIERKQ